MCFGGLLFRAKLQPLAFAQKKKNTKSYNIHFLTENLVCETFHLLVSLAKILRRLQRSIPSAACGLLREADWLELICLRDDCGIIPRLTSSFHICFRSKPWLQEICPA